jgi:hypothetical protein
MEVRVKSGAVTLDFTEAVITQPLLPIDADVGASWPGLAHDICGYAECHAEQTDGSIEAVGVTHCRSASCCRGGACMK